VVRGLLYRDAEIADIAGRLDNSHRVNKAFARRCLAFAPMKRTVGIGLVALALVTGGVVLAASDFGSDRDKSLADKSHQLFGTGKPLDASSSDSISAAQAQADPTSLVTLAKGLSARVVTSNVAGPNIDQMAFWPDATHPTHLIACNEEGVAQPGLQRINLSDGSTDTIVSGLNSCDPVRHTPWGTILFGEESGGGPAGGRMYELIDPLNTTDVTLDRATGTFSGGIGASNMTPRPALGRLSFEGLAIYANGVTYYGDENRPATGTSGGAYFKFIPSSLRDPASTTPIQSLSQSPYAAGSIFGLRVGIRPGTADYGQGTQWGLAAWVPIPAAPDADLRAQAAALKLTGYYRPEDIDIDAAALADGNVRFCGSDTGNEIDDQLWGEVVCITDGSVDGAAGNIGHPQIQLFVQGNPSLSMPDNVAYQPGRGNWVIHEDADTTTDLQGKHNDDLWDCMPDGADNDLMSDGCIRIGTLNDLTAEWTGGIFDPTGKHFYVSVQHNISGKGTVLDITGWD
jgi:secreted PhoX family phosphatase